MPNHVPTYSKLEWDLTKKHWHGTCAYCGGSRKAKKRGLTKDHVIPESIGGQKIRHNIIPACGQCNQDKSSLPMEQWYRSQPFFSETKLLKIFQWCCGNCYTIPMNRQYEPQGTLVPKKK